MRIFAYCVKSAASSVAAALGVQPLTSPPTDATSFMPEWLAGHDLIYFRLHGVRFYPAWFNDQDNAALTGDILERADLGGAVVIVANCYGTEDPMIGALYRAGASVVIAGAGPNYAASNVVIGADLLAQWIRRLLSAKLPAWLALAVAKTRMCATAWRHTDRDAMAFRIMEAEHDT